MLCNTNSAGRNPSERCPEYGREERGMVFADLYQSVTRPRILGYSKQEGDGAHPSQT
jgi:hypothetical protein